MRPLTGEQLREECLDASARLRDSFIRYDAQLSGTVAAWQASTCIKTAGLHKTLDVNSIIAKHTRPDGRFGWLGFVQNLEKSAKRHIAVPVGASTLARSPSTLKLLQETQGKFETGSAAALPPLLRVGSTGSKSRLARIHSPSLLLRAPAHPHGTPNTHGAPPLPRAYSSGYLKQSDSVQSLLSSGHSVSREQLNMRSTKLRSMGSAAELRATLLEQRNEERLQRELSYQMRAQAAAERRAETQTSQASLVGEMDPAGDTASVTGGVDEAADMADVARQANRQKLKSSTFVKGASDALNSRFSDMFKAFQYVDLDRSGTLDNKEIRRALDLWNIPIDDVKLAELIQACDHDGDGQVDYKEFVDVLARDTVAPAAMGKRGMQSKEAMGVDSQEALAAQLGHKSEAEIAKQKSFSVSINS